MVAEPLRSARTTLLLNRREHVRHVVRVVAGGGHDLGALEIRIALVLAAEFEEYGANAQLGTLGHHLTPAATNNGAEHGAGDLAHAVFRGLACLRRPMTEDDVAQLVRHHPRDFAVGVRRLDHAAVDEHRTAWQREGVDLFDVHDFERVLKLGMPQIGRDDRHQPVSDVLDERCDVVVAHRR